MHTITQRVARAGAVAAALTLATPLCALADEESSIGIDLLIPKVGEFVPTLIAFLIIFFVVAKLVWPSVLDTMEKREAKIQDALDEADKLEAKTAEAQKAYEAELVRARVDAEQIRANARKEAEEERVQVLERAQREAAAIIAKSHDAVDAERHRAMVELSTSVVDLAVEIAAKIIGNDLSVEQQRALAEKYLAEVASPDDDQL